MKYYLKSKYKNTDADWKYVFDNIEDFISFEEIDAMVTEKAKEINERTKGKKVSIAWSGGKDSIALEVIAEKAGIHDGVCVYHNDFSYGIYIDWILKNKPAWVNMQSAPISIDWLVKHPDFLFAGSSAKNYRLYKMFQQAGVAEYALKNKIDVVLVGKRKQDANVVIKEDNYMRDKNGWKAFNCIADWKHEHVLAAIHYYGKKLFPLYFDKFGFAIDWHLWITRVVHDGNLCTGWKLVYNYDPVLVRRIAPLFPSGREFLKSIGE